MSKSSYTDLNGISHSLTEKTTTDISEMERFEHMASEKARKYAEEYNTDVFYCLKSIDPIEGKWSKGQFFFIPIDRSEVSVIDKEYGAECYVGICYANNPKPVEKDEKPLDGYDYEKHCADWLSMNGYTDIEVTKKSGDQGIDIIAYKDGLKYGIQCKYYKGSVPNKAVQEAYSGSKYYNCNVAMVMTTGQFTKQAIELARALGVKLFQKN